MNTNILKDNAETNNETPELVMDDISNELSRVLDSIQLQRSFSSSLNEKHIDNE